MPVRAPQIRGPMTTATSGDPGRSRRTGLGDGNQVVYAIVGHQDPNPAYVEIRNGQPWVEITLKPEGDEVTARLALPGAGDDSGWYIPLDFGCRVIVELIDGDPNEGVIVGRAWDQTCKMPGDVAGVSTGADGKVDQSTGPAPAWQFIKTRSGQMLAIETGALGDIVIHSAGSILMKTGGGGAMQLEGTVHLGTAATSEPTGATVGPAGVDLPGVPAVPLIPTPYTAIPNSTPAHIPYAGNNDGIIRAKESYQFTAATDQVGYPQFAAVYSHPLIGLIAPLALVSHPRGGAPGTKHTASD